MEWFGGVGFDGENSLCGKGCHLLERRPVSPTNDDHYNSPWPTNIRRWTKPRTELWPMTKPHTSPHPTLLFTSSCPAIIPYCLTNAMYLQTTFISISTWLTNIGFRFQYVLKYRIKIVLTHVDNQLMRGS